MNPMMQQLIERNPEINHLLNNNEILRHSMEMIRNPAAFQELMRTQDRALSNLESLPGGYNALRRMYTELQEPMLNAASEQLTGENPFASFARQDNAGSTNTQAGTENRDPLPNPWSSDNQTTGSTNNSTANPLGSLNSNRSLNDYMGSLMENREFMNQMLNSPQTQQVMEQLMSNPNLMRSMMSNNPLLSNPNSQELNNLLPAAMQQMQSPEMRELLSNPEAIEAMMQISRGMEQLQRVAPGFINNAFANNQSLFPTFATTNSSVPTTNTSTTANTTNSANTTTTSAPPTNQANVNLISQLMSQMLASGNLPTDNSTTNPQPPEERYRNQLEQLNSMGFTDRQQNIMHY